MKIFVIIVEPIAITKKNEGMNLIVESSDDTNGITNFTT